ncbi:MAG TPA: 2-hydroxychromene-2-carboxylate isomerase [Labilithrix sp.]
MPNVDFYFDYTCPFAYLASTQVPAECTYRPILLGGVFKAVGQEQNLAGTLSPQKQAHNLADMQRWAKHFGVELRMPPTHPMRSVEALRATLATGIDRKVVNAFYRAYWIENRNIADRNVVADVLTKAGQDATRVMERASSREVKDDLRKRTDEAVARGVFGVPTFIVDGKELYWGQDRMSFVFGTKWPPAKKAPAGTVIDVYWDFSSPFAYLASTQLAALAARTGATLVEKPILLGGLFRSIGTADVPLATFSEAKQRHVSADLDRWAKKWGVPFRFPSRFPMLTVKALRVWYALAPEKRAAFRDATMRAFWAEDRDIADDAVLASLAGDPEAVARSSADDVKAALRASTDEAAAKNVFGVPTFVVNGRDLWWGQDRIELLERAIAE